MKRPSVFRMLISVPLVLIPMAVCGDANEPKTLDDFVAIIDSMRRVYGTQDVSEVSLELCYRMQEYVKFHNLSSKINITMEPAGYNGQFVKYPCGLTIQGTPLAIVACIKAATELKALRDETVAHTTLTPEMRQDVARMYCLKGNRPVRRAVCGDGNDNRCAMLYKLSALSDTMHYISCCKLPLDKISIVPKTDTFNDGWTMTPIVAASSDEFSIPYTSPAIDLSEDSFVSSAPLDMFDENCQPIQEIK